jgi:DNA-binding response OmpR family regulator
MPTSDIIKAKLLFVDDDRTFLDFLHQTFVEFSRNQWEMKCVTDAAQALEFLRHEKVDLATLDLQMPNVDGLQLLRMLKREFPTLQMAFLTGQGDGQSRRIGLEEGAALFLEKPASLAGMENLFATINELARWQQRLGERSVVRRAGLLDLVKMECKSGNSRLLEVVAAEERGQIWIKAGAIIHALAPEKCGQSAFTHLMCLPQAEFHLKPFVEPIESSVNHEWEFLVLEAARVQGQLLKAPKPPPVEPPATIAKPPSRETTPRPAVPATPEKITPIKLSVRLPPPPVHRIAAPVPEVAVVPSAQPPPPPPVAPVFPAVMAAPVTRALAIEPNAPGFHLEEMLVCSERREVYYEWKCTELQKRLSLIEFIAHQARQLGQGLPLGRIDRLELQSIAGRIIVQFQPSRIVFLRSNTRARPPAEVEAQSPKTVLEWFARQSVARGLLACGVALPDQKVLTQSFTKDIALAALNNAWPCLADTFDAATRFQFPAWQLRWIYERAQIYCVRRTDGTSLGLLLQKPPVAVDLAAVEKLFTEFHSLRAD